MRGRRAEVKASIRVPATGQGTDALKEIVGRKQWVTRTDGGQRSAATGDVVPRRLGLAADPRTEWVRGYWPLRLAEFRTTDGRHAWFWCASAVTSGLCAPQRMM